MLDDLMMVPDLPELPIIREQFTCLQDTGYD